MVAFNKFEIFTTDLCSGFHSMLAADDVLKVYASNATPSTSADAVKADLAEITPENGYPSGGTDVANDVTQSGGVASVVGTDVVWTAGAGGFGPLRYIPLYNDTSTSPADPLIGWWDYGSSVSPAEGETFTVDFGSEMFTVE